MKEIKAQKKIARRSPTSERLEIKFYLWRIEIFAHPIQSI